MSHVVSDHEIYRLPNQQLIIFSNLSQLVADC